MTLKDDNVADESHMFLRWNRATHRTKRFVLVCTSLPRGSWCSAHCPCFADWLAYGSGSTPLPTWEARPCKVLGPALRVRASQIGSCTVLGSAPHAADLMCMRLERLEHSFPCHPVSFARVLDGKDSHQTAALFGM